jgi:Uma2 family endonuclease
MSGIIAPPPPPETLADLLERLGYISPARVRLDPPPGQATETDLLALSAATDRLYELVDGVLVEKAMGFYEPIVAAVLIGYLREFVRTHRLGVVLGADGTMRLAPRLVRIPDVAFISWDRFPNRKLARAPIPNLAPDLAIEVLSEGNTPAEMERKLREYFDAGVRLVWYADPKTRAVRVYTAVDRCRVVTEDETLDGGDVLPGFTLSVRQWFEEAGEQEQ